MNVEAFERDRLALFHHFGFAGRSRRFDDGRGGTTYAIMGGEGARPTILVHGGLADASVWAPLTGRLQGALVIPDRPGHGLTSPIDYTGADYRKLAEEWLLSVVDALGAPQVDLVGNSMGGYFSMAFALRHPKRVRRLALVGAPAGIDRELPLFLRMWGRPVVGRLVSAMMARTADPEALRKQVLAPMCAHPERISVEQLRVKIAAASKPAWHVTARSMIHAVSDLGGWRPALNLREEMTRLEVPTLFAWGDKDNFAPPSSGQQLASRMPDARFELLDDAGHLPQLDAPDALAKSVARFFAADDPARAAA